MRYYSIQRPVTPGSFPKPKGNKVLNITSFDSKTYCDELGREVWGYVEYERPLSEKEAQDWELTPDWPLWFPVTVSSRKHGGGLRVMAGRPVRVAQRPEDTKGDTHKMQYKTRYFCSQEAERVVSVIQSLDITTERVRMSMTQGEVKVYINGQYILSFGDNIVLQERGSNPEDYYGDNIGGWCSNKPDSGFVLDLIWHPFDYVYHYSEMVCSKLGIKPEEWIGG